MEDKSVTEPAEMTDEQLSKKATSVKEALAALRKEEDVLKKEQSKRDGEAVVEVDEVTAPKQHVHSD